MTVTMAANRESLPEEGAGPEAEVPPEPQPSPELIAFADAICPQIRSQADLTSLCRSFAAAASDIAAIQRLQPDLQALAEAFREQLFNTAEAWRRQRGEPPG